MTELTGEAGFVTRREQTHTTRRALAIDLIATVALTVSLVVAATAVSLGNRSFARGEVSFDRAPVVVPLALRD